MNLSFWNKLLLAASCILLLALSSATPIKAQTEEAFGDDATDPVRLFERGLGRGALDLSAVNEQLPDALALLFLLDEYIGVSNTNVYLRNGLPGKTARILVRTPPEWRWAGSTAASRWFPRFVVYRQARGENWDRSLAQLTVDLTEIYAAPHQK